MFFKSKLKKQDVDDVVIHKKEKNQPHTELEKPHVEETVSQQSTQTIPIDAPPCPPPYYSSTCNSPFPKEEDIQTIFQLGVTPIFPHQPLYDPTKVEIICENFPLDLWEQIIQFIPKYNKPDFRLVSKDLKEIVDQDQIWKNYFVQQTTLLPIKDKSWFECFVLSNKRKIQEQTYIHKYQSQLPPPMPPPPCGIGYHPYMYNSFNPKPTPKPVNKNILSTFEKVKLLETMLNLLEVERHRNDVDLKLGLVRYEKFMCLKAKYPDILLVPTVDIEIVWVTHLLRPLIYQKDCMKLFGKIIDHEFPKFVNNTFYLYHDAILQTSNLWKENFGSDYGVSDRMLSKYSIIESNQAVTKEHQITYYIGQYNSEQDWKNPFSISIDDLEKDKEWLVNYYKSVERYDTDYDRTIDDYEKFMLLVAENPLTDGKMYHPSYSVDLVWHSHMLFPLWYNKFCKETIGNFIEHLPWPKEIDEEGHEKIKSLFKDTYGHEMKK